MNKKKFVEELNKQLKHLPEEDREDALAGVVCLVVSFVTLGFFNKLQCIGMGLICISLGVLFVFGIIKLSQVCVRGIAGFMCAK